MSRPFHLIMAACLLPWPSAADTLLSDFFCQKYYPQGAAAAGLPPCEDVRSATVANLSRPLPTLELGDPAKPAMFFVHGWPDSAAEFAAQFGGFCYGPGARSNRPAWHVCPSHLPGSPGVAWIARPQDLPLLCLVLGYPLSLAVFERTKRIYPSRWKLDRFLVWWSSRMRFFEKEMDIQNPDTATSS
eukprot:gene7447-6980_t